jgi:hypothetical protein
MTRWFTFFAIAAGSLCAHCADDDGGTWEKGRVYVQSDVTMVRVTDSIVPASEVPVAAGDVVYRATLDIAPGTLPSDATQASAFAFLPLGQTLAAGDEAAECQVYSDGAVEGTCQALRSGEGANGIDLRESDLLLYEPWKIWLTSPIVGVTFEVRRPASAPSLEGVNWKVILADSKCEPALNARHHLPACPDGAECTSVGIEYVVDATTCRWRNENQSN